MRFLLVRHALTDAVGRTLSGRAPGVSLSAAGRAQAARLGARLAAPRLDAVVASPMARALETAAAVARPHGLPVEVAPGLVELDFGDWTGQAIDGLAGDATWGWFNGNRGGTRIPRGELALEAQARAVAAVLALAARWPDGRVAAVSHADVCRAVVGHLLGIPLDLQHRLEIAPASVAEIELAPWGARLLSLGATVD